MISRHELDVQSPDGATALVSHAMQLLLGNSPQLDCSESGRRFRAHPSANGVFNDRVAALVLRALAQGSTDEQLAQWKQEPFWLPIDARARKLEDWFLAFMEAAAAYDGRDQPKTAWHMLGWGAFWVGHYKHGAWRAFFDAALALAERRGWEDAARALRFQAEMAGLE